MDTVIKRVIEYNEHSKMMDMIISISQNQAIPLFKRKRMIEDLIKADKQTKTIQVSNGRSFEINNTKPPTDETPPKIVEKRKVGYYYQLKIADGNLAFQFAFLWGLIKINFVYRGKGSK